MGLSVPWWVPELWKPDGERLGRSGDWVEGPLSVGLGIESRKRITSAVDDGLLTGVRVGH